MKHLQVSYSDDLITITGEDLPNGAETYQPRDYGYDYDDLCRAVADDVRRIVRGVGFART